MMVEEESLETETIAEAILKMVLVSESTHTQCQGTPCLNQV